LAGAATQTFARGGKHPRAASGAVPLPRILYQPHQRPESSMLWQNSTLLGRLDTILCIEPIQLVAMATSLERSQPNFAAIIYAHRAINPENLAKISPLLSDSSAGTIFSLGGQTRRVGGWTRSGKLTLTLTSLTSVD